MMLTAIGAGFCVACVGYFLFVEPISPVGIGRLPDGPTALGLLFVTIVVAAILYPLIRRL
jgi:hypothetical protein